MAAPSPATILTINGGSSSIKFALYAVGKDLQRKLSGKIERIGLSDPKLNFTIAGSDHPGSMPVKAANIGEAVAALTSWLEQQEGYAALKGIGHRIVQGMQYHEPSRIDPVLLEHLHSIESYDPDHLPGELELIETFSQHHPGLPQVACFDTAFHADLPRVARILPIPRRFDISGIQRYGFHGLSYAYLMETLIGMTNGRAASARVILAHLGNGASMTAVRDGKSIDTSMGFTPAGGFCMGTRPGDLDPGVAWYIFNKEKMNATQFNDLINHRSGLLGVSETSSDLRDLLEKESTDVRAAEAIALFCYQVKKWIGSFTAVLGGLDMLAFTGGIGENAGLIRSRICAGLEYLGITLAEKKNEKNDSIISVADSPVTVYVIPADEESMIARNVTKVLELDNNHKN